MYAVSEKELTRLLEITTKLEAINLELNSSLKISKKQMENLEKDSQALSKELIESKQKSEGLETTSIQLSEALSKATDSLTKMNESFEAYKKEAESKLDKSEKARKGWKSIAIPSLGAALIEAGIIALFVLL